MKEEIDNVKGQIETIFDKLTQIESRLNMLDEGLQASLIDTSELKQRYFKDREEMYNEFKELFDYREK